MAKAPKTMLENVKRVGTVLFLSGFLFAVPLLSGIGAVIWGGVTILNVATGTKE